MKLSIESNNKNYAATIVEIKEIYNIPNADNIVRTIINGNNVIIGKDINIGDKMIYFVSGTRLNPDYCKFNNLYSNTEYNLNTDQKPGYLSYKQHRVKAIKLRGIISDGFLLPLNSLDAFHLDIKKTLNIGDTFTHIDDIMICEKYIVKVRNANPGGRSPKAVNKFNRLIDNQFYLHGDTANLRVNMHKIKPDDIIGIHYKKHGTSAVFANIPTLLQLSWWGKILKFLGVKIDTKIYDIVYSSRTVVKNKYINQDKGAGYYGEDIWGVVAKEIGHLIPKNWTIYGEILGYLPSGGYIQKGYDYGCNVPIRKHENTYIGKKVKKESGRPFKSTFIINTVKDITINPNTNNKAFSFIEDDSLVDCHQCISASNHKFYVYKVSVVNPNGKVIYLTDLQIKEWCDKVGLLYSDTLIYYGNAHNWLSERLSNIYSNNENWSKYFIEELEKEYNEKDCYMCANKVPEEGIVLRIEHLEEYEAYKLKSKRFILRESEEQEEEQVNIEDNS